MKVSINIIYFLLLISIFSCNKQEHTLSPMQINQKVDSIIQQKEKVLRKQAQEDLNRRMSIEIKPKVDSMLNRVTLPDSMVTPQLDTSGDW